MRYAIIGRAPQELIDDKPYFKHFVKSMITDENRELFRQSKRFMNYKVEIGHRGNDFVYSLVSIRVLGNVYKLSRIIKNRLYARQIR